MSAIYANCCFRYHKGTDFQANHNVSQFIGVNVIVVLDTTKVQIFKQITTVKGVWVHNASLFQIPQRYRFSSKSQLIVRITQERKRCFRYHKGTDFQANHNYVSGDKLLIKLFQIPQRYRFSSKSQRAGLGSGFSNCCFRYHKGTDFQANHNCIREVFMSRFVVLDTTKVQIFKQITT